MRYFENSFASEQFISRLVSEAIGQSIVRIDNIAVGVTTHKYVATSEYGNKYVIRFYPEVMSQTIQFEPDLLNIARSLGALVPVVVYDSRREPDKLNYIIYEMLIGNALSQALNHSIFYDNKIIDEIYDNMKTIHKIVFNGFGVIKNSREALSLKWIDFIDDVIIEGMRNINQFNFSDSTRFKLEKFLAEISSEIRKEVIEPQFIWSDISLDNIIIKDSKLVGFIDFDSVLSGDIFMEMGCLLAREGDSIFFKLLSSKYKNLNGYYKEKIDFYSIIRLLRISKFLSNPLPNGSKRDKINFVFPGSFDVINNL